MEIKRKKMPKVSIIVPIYNVEKYIEYCARSLFEQTLFDVEYVFVDDSSSDKSMDVLDLVIKEYPQRIHQIQIIRHEKNQGNSITRNTGLMHARGEFIAYCDSDDWVEPNMYEKLYDTALREDADVVYCDINMVQKHRQEIYKSAQWCEDKTKLIQNYISTTWTCLVLMMAKNSLYKNNKLTSPPHLSYCEDFWLAVRLMHYAKKVCYVPDALYNYNRFNETSVVHSLNKKTEREEQTAYLETIAFFEAEGVLEYYKKQMGWRILKSKQELVLDVNHHDEFLKIYPESHNHIWDCPYINKKLKIMMWCLTHHLSWITYAMISVRNFKENFIRR